MMYPVAVDGRMPFVDAKSYREQQIRKVIQKHRAKRQRESDKLCTGVPTHPTLQRVHSPRFLDTHLDLTNITDDQHSISKRNILHAIKRFFCNSAKSTSAITANTAAPTSVQSTPYQPKFKGKANTNRHSAPVNISITSRKQSLNSNSPPSVSPKRCRRRTVSNIGSIMETIDEIPENIILEKECESDSSDTESYGISSLSSVNGLHSVEGSLSSLLSEATSHSQILSCTS